MRLAALKLERSRFSCRFDIALPIINARAALLEPTNNSEQNKQTTIKTSTHTHTHTHKRTIVVSVRFAVRQLFSCLLNHVPSVLVVFGYSLMMIH
jgi:hypothetical protein